MKRSLFARFLRLNMFFYIVGLLLVLLAFAGALVNYIKTGEFYILRLSGSEEGGTETSFILYAATYVYLFAIGQMVADHSNAYAFLRKHVFTRSGEIKWNLFHIICAFVTVLPVLVLSFALDCFSGIQLLSYVLFCTGACSLVKLIMYIKGHSAIKIFLVLVYFCACGVIGLSGSWALGKALGCYILLAVGAALTAVSLAAVGYIVCRTRLDAKGMIEQTEEQAI